MKRHQVHLGIALLTSGLVLMAQCVLAAEPDEVDTRNDTISEPFAPDVALSLRSPLHSTENFSFGAVTESSGGEPSASELNRQLTNPVSSL